MKKLADDVIPSIVTGTTFQRVLQALLNIHERLNTTVIVITHNAAIAGMADRVIHLAGGRIQREERPALKLRPDQLSW